MIKINQCEITVGHFPDGTQNLHIPEAANKSNPIYIEWKYERDEELVTLMYVSMHFKALPKILIMPYIPNARMDRVKNPGEVFTLKYFCEFINSLGFEKVYVLDPHSDVSAALLDNVFVIQPTAKITTVIKDINNNDLVLFYPDNGAAKRYSDLISKPYCYGIKNRDWASGKILSLDVITNGIDLAGKDVLIVDDICSRGGTFFHSAKKLKELGVSKIYLYVSHCENTIKDGDLLKDIDLVEKIYTTDSIYSLNEEKVEVIL